MINDLSGKAYQLPIFSTSILPANTRKIAILMYLCPRELNDSCWSPIVEIAIYDEEGN